MMDGDTLTGPTVISASQVVAQGDDLDAIVEEAMCGNIQRAARRMKVQYDKKRKRATHFKMPNIKLQSSDGETFEIDVEIAKCSVTIKTMLEDLGMDDDEEEVVPLPNVNSAILKKVIQWATYHKDDPPPPEDDENKEKRTDDISSWDADFLKVDQGTLFELILAANYLDIKGLLDVTCKTVANMIKGKTPEEIRKTFNIKNDFTASEEEQNFMEYFSKTAAFISILIVISFVSNTLQTKKVDCRKYVYAPVCRGVQARSAIPAFRFGLLPLVREPRTKSAISNLDIAQWKNKDREAYYDSPIQKYFEKSQSGDYDDNDIASY
ncbi:hypothetical protein RN001_003591 [Aquatica leii]|uniref:S-phase kinase-associated protein 1 n=1 Tax=Aquatica leii TaxID=1421715 RepID=A0AAN7PFA4_9COLE|nr:hypothetical protein RN001_003591 [Aquatica leii]